MPRPKKSFTQPKRILEYDNDGELVEKDDCRLPGLIHPQQWDIEEEFQSSEALRDILREKEDLDSF